METTNTTTAFLTEPEAFTASQESSYTPTPLALLLGTLLLTVLSTRLFSTRYTSPTILPNDALTVPTEPYWLPLLGHLPSMAWDAATFTRALRSKYPRGAFALNFGGGKHNIFHSPALASALLNHRDGKLSSDSVAQKIMVDIFGFPSAELGKYEAAWEDLVGCYRHILSEPGLGRMVERTVGKVRENVLFLVSGAESPVDQSGWERVSDVEVTKDTQGREVVEASLLPLIRDFIAHTANPTLMGSNFLVNNPDFFEGIWTLDRGFLLLATGLPRWVPIPQVTRAHIAKKRNVDTLEGFHRAMEAEANGQDAGADWRDLDDVGDLVKARMEVYRKHGLSVRARAATEHSLLWAANANSNPLVFWMLNRIYADRELLSQIREEIARYVKVLQPKQELAVPELPRFETFDVEGLCTKCPLLKSCYVESLRLDSATWSLKVVQEDFVLQGREKDAPGWQLRKGEFAHAAHDLHATDPKAFADPLVWKGDRHIKRANGENTATATADLGSLRPYGGGTSMCKGRAFALKEVLMFTAAIVAVWEIEPKGGGQWQMPRYRKATGVFGTGDDTRVWLRRREFEAG